MTLEQAADQEAELAGRLKLEHILIAYFDNNRLT